jgi:hypothetical protein
MIIAYIDPGAGTPIIPIVIIAVAILGIIGFSLSRRKRTRPSGHAGNNIPGSQPSSNASSLALSCPSCGKVVSREADKCPNCGHPIRGGILGGSGAERTINEVALGLIIVLAAIAVIIFIIRGC